MIINKLTQLTIFIVFSILFTVSVSAATFTVDSTGDEVDLSPGNGICATSLGTCTLRAAIQEANALAGADNIHFNIPTSDAGYRDYDNPDTPSSGDSTGGDDYWTIRPASNLPTLTEATILDGATQTTNQSNSNTSGPEIEIKRGMVFTTDSSVNSVLINGGYYLHTGSIFTLTNSYLGTDPKSLVYTGGGQIVISGSNVNIGNTVSDGNVITSNIDTPIVLNCTSNYENVKISGNRVNMSHDTSVAFTPVAQTAIYILGSEDCNVVVGGDNEQERNFIAGSTRGIRFTATNTYAEIYNNFFGTDMTGTQRRSISGSNYATWAVNVDTGSDNLNSTLIVGAPGKGNLFRYWTNAIRIGADVQALIQNNTVSDCGNLLSPGSGRCIVNGNPLHISNYDRVEILNNFIGSIEEDPYFGLSVGMSGQQGHIGIINWSAAPTIKGNIITGLNGFGIYTYPAFASNRTTSSTYRAPQPTIGGSSVLSGSLCEGLEKNCITNNAQIGILNIDTIPINENTLYTDNTFANNGAEGSRNIEQAWLGLFELHSSNYRRTDLTGTVLTFPEGTKVRTTDDPASEVTSGTAINVTCLGTSGVSCPATGHTAGTLNSTYTVVPTGQTATALNNVLPWFRITEYIYDGDGNKIDYGTFKFEQPHFASNTFTFDGNSTNNVINTGGARTIDGQNYTDRGEPWTDRPGATRNIATGDIGRFQIMEVEFVDANPIQNEDGDWIITVDSTEDYVSNLQSIGGGTLKYFDDGSGQASGGISQLNTGVLPNGRTSLREAITTGVYRPGIDKINFNIPTSDPGYINPDGSRTSTSEPEGTYTQTSSGFFSITPSTHIITNAIGREVITYDQSNPDHTFENYGLFIDGYSQPGAVRNTNTFGEPINAVLKIQLSNSTVQITGNNIHIAGLNVWNANVHDINNVGFIGGGCAGANNNWIEGSFIGTNILGTIANTSAGSGAVTIRSSGCPNTSNNIIGTNGDGINDMGERNLISGQTTNNQVADFNTLGSNTVIAGNYLGTDYTGRNCIRPNSGNDWTVIQIGWDGSRVGTNSDGISDEEEGNIMGCVNSNVRAIIRLCNTNYSNITIAGNYFGTNPHLDDLTPIPIEGLYSCVNAVNLKVYNNIFSGLRYAIINQPGFINTEIVGNTFRDISTDSILVQASDQLKIFNNQFYNVNNGIRTNLNATSDFTARNNKFIGSTNTAIDLNFDQVTPNDLGDSDTGPNDLMNYPEIHRVTYLSGGKYKIEGILDNNVSGEGPFDIEICLSDNHSSGHGGCIETLGYFENKIEQVTGGINPYSVEVTVEGDNGTQDRIFTSLATNNNGSTSEFSQNFNTENNENFTLATYNINLTKPLNNERLTNRSPKLEWEASQDEDLKHYELYINQIFYSVTNTNSIQIPYELPYGRYQWQVVGVRENNTESGRSETRTFEVIETPEEETPESFPILEPLTEQPEREVTIQDNNEEEESNQGTIQGELIRNILIVGGVTGASGVGVYWLLLFFKRRKRNSQQ